MVQLFLSFLFSNQNHVLYSEFRYPLRSLNRLTVEKSSELRVTFRKCDEKADENAENSMAHDSSIATIDSDSSDNEIQFVSQSKASSDTIQIKRLTKKINDLQHQLKKEKKKNAAQLDIINCQNKIINWMSGPSSSVSVAGATSTIASNTAIPNYSANSLPGPSNAHNQNSSNQSLNDSIVDQVAARITSNPDELGAFMDYLNENE